jgi:predicted GNAT family acetyltransferase
MAIVQGSGRRGSGRDRSKNDEQALHHWNGDRNQSAPDSARRQDPVHRHPLINVLPPCGPAEHSPPPRIRPGNPMQTGVRMNSQATVVADNPAQQRYELRSGDEVLGTASYRMDGGDTMVFTHTVVDPQQEGKGYGSELARGALDDVRSGNRKVVASCEFIARYIDEHPEYRDLLKTG